MHKLIYLSLCFAAVLIASCKKHSEDQEVKKPLIISGAVDTLSGDIRVNTVVTKTTFLDGIVYVRPGVTLTINAGVTILGKTTPFGTPADLVNLANNKGTLVVERGADIIANGTPSSPIVWTSTNPVGSRNPGDWGGLLILGAAPIITAFGATTNSFEALRNLSNRRNDYGGTNPADNSGSLTYNRIEFGGGFITASDREVNGLTLCGVGNGTTINHIEVSNSGDDGFEFFGGTVNADHLLSFSNTDDDFDFDEAYSGNLQFIIAYRSDLADDSGSENVELDGNSGGFVYFGARTQPYIANATLIGPVSPTPRDLPGSLVDRFDGAVFTRRNGRLILLNSLIIAQAFPVAFATTPTTDASFFGPRPPLDNTLSAVLNNIFQANNFGNAVWLDVNEVVPIPPGGTPNAALISDLGAKGNTALATFGDFALGAALENTPASPSFSGGIDLAALGLPFVGTTERGAVRSNDVWTNGPWISIELN